MVDDAILDVSDFAQRHPGGRRLILNTVGTDVTQELIGRDKSVGYGMSFSPHTHSGVRTDVVRIMKDYIQCRPATQFEGLSAVE